MGTQRAFLIVALVAALLAGVVQATDIAGSIEAGTIDTRFKLRGDVQPRRDVALVLIDDETFDALHERWPFPRDQHAKVIDRLHAAGAKVIAYDVEFTEPSDDPDADGALLDAADAARPVVFSVVSVDRRGRSTLFGGGRIIEEVGAVPAITTLPVDHGGVVRRVDAGERGVPTFAVAAAQLATGRRIPPGAFPESGDSAYIAYAGRALTLPHFPFSDVLNGRFPKDAFRGKVVVVGASYAALQDIKAVPVSDAVMSGPEVQANAVATILGGFPLRTVPTWLEVLIAVLFAAAVPLLMLRAAFQVTLAAGVALLIAWPISAYLLFTADRIVPVVTPLGGLLVGAVGTIAVHAIGQAFERARTRDAFARFAPAAVVDQVLAKAGDGARLGGRRATSTVLFSDLRGFTSFAERVEPEVVIDLLNRYLTEMSDAILDHGGTLVSYMGDGIMAVFGAPLDQPDHADRALAAAREMNGPRLQAFNDFIAQQGHDHAFAMGVGLNTGAVLSGNVGSERRMEYTAIGDTTNTASRLEAMTKNLPCHVVLSEATRVALTRDAGELTDLGEVEVRGRVEGLRIWGAG